MISFDFDDFFQASQPSTMKPRLTATSAIRSRRYYGRLAKTATNVLVKKKTLVNRVTPLKRPILGGPLVTVLTGFHCMNFNISTLVYRDEKKTTHRVSDVYAYTKTWRRLPFLREKATGYYFRKGDYWSFD